jgi:hypothetical protein
LIAPFLLGESAGLDYTSFELERIRQVSANFSSVVVISGAGR